MEIGRHVEKFHPQLEGKHVLFVDKSLLTPGYVSHMTGLEKMKVTTIDNLLQVPNLAELMEERQIDFAIIHNFAPDEVDRITEAVKKGKVVVVQEKNLDLEINRQMNERLRNSGVKSFPRAEPDHIKAFNKCLDYLSTKA